MEDYLKERLSKWVNEHRNELVQDLISVVNIRSVREAAAGNSPFGEGTARVIDKGLELGNKYGFETENDDYYSVSFIRKGKSKRELGIIGHIDVVHEGNDWTFAPYNAVEKDGYVIGRGAGDNKGPSVAALYVLGALDELNIELDHSVRVIWGANEESGMEDVKHYIKTHPDLPDYTLVCDSEFPVSIGEKGSISADLVFDIGDDSNILDFSGGLSSNAVPDYAAIVLNANLQEIKNALKDKAVEISGEDGRVHISARGIAGHAARPENTGSAIQKLAQFVTDGNVIKGKKAYDAVKFIAEAFADYYGEGIGFAFEDEISGKTTHIGGIIKLENRKLRQNFNARRSIGSNADELLKNLYKIGEEKGFTVENLRQSPTRYDDPESPQIKILIESAKEFLGEDLQPPFTTGGGTHAKHFPNSVPYGARVPLKAGEKSKFGGAHAADEAVRIDDLLEAIKIYISAIVRLDALYKI
ncbi:Sapep family Mn(2+)-dependent dipeptidase [Anaeropeptidivorans aminofermentans]|uniref:Sapep family Mn(2+)-dependent dipeptidase n=1 Tax=Anaeropeptidivorans aminofermentans TaxID=2934315 RepID=UPI002024F99D|nr:Sapep family Mn(2+)-dependent dipeptidase [Anaeropeptidivorans aminofermentans]